MKPLNFFLTLALLIGQLACGQNAKNTLKPSDDKSMTKKPPIYVAGEFHRSDRAFYPLAKHYDSLAVWTFSQPVEDRHYVDGNPVAVLFEAPADVSLQKSKLTYAYQGEHRQKVGSTTAGPVEVRKINDRLFQIVIDRKLYDEAMSLAETHIKAEVALSFEVYAPGYQFGLIFDDVLGLSYGKEKPASKLVGVLRVPIHGAKAAVWTDLASNMLAIRAYPEEIYRELWVGMDSWSLEAKNPKIQLRLRVTGDGLCELELNQIWHGPKCKLIENYLVLENFGHIDLSEKARSDGYFRWMMPKSVVGENVIEDLQTSEELTSIEMKPIAK